MNETSAIAWLNGLFSYEKRLPDKYSGETYDLENFRRLLARLKNPHLSLNAVHVAGTDGKGSTCAFAESILRHAGLRTGLYTSPHLVTYRERIRIEGEVIDGERFGNAIEEVKRAIEAQAESGERKPVREAGFATVFEVLTAAAFLVFRELALDAVVLEVGLGGRLDATNVIVPRAAVITPIHLDHTHLLGNTLSSIAREKAGILKPGIPFVMGFQRPEAEEVLLSVAEERACPVSRYGRDFRSDCVEKSRCGYAFDLTIRGKRFKNVPIRMLGDFQGANASCAWEACLLLSESLGFRLSDEDAMEGIRKTRWPARAETWNHLGVDVLLDCAHTEEAATALRETVDAVREGRPIVWLLAFSEDKRVPETLRALLRPGERVIATQTANPRALAEDHLASLALNLGCESTPVHPVEDAFTLAIEAARQSEGREISGSPPYEGGVGGGSEFLYVPERISPDPSFVRREILRSPHREENAWLVITGSVYLAGAVRPLLGETQTV